MIIIYICNDHYLQFFATLVDCPHVNPLPVNLLKGNSNEYLEIHQTRNDPFQRDLLCKFKNNLQQHQEGRGRGLETSDIGKRRPRRVEHGQRKKRFITNVYVNKTKAYIFFITNIRSEKTSKGMDQLAR
jgi:hypothetical protein